MPGIPGKEDELPETRVTGGGEMDFPARELIGARQRWGFALVVIAVAALILATAGSAAAAGDCANAWGNGEFGQLGNGTSRNNHLPGPVSELCEVTAISAGGNFSLALSAGGVKAWGFNSVGQLGDGTTAESRLPVAVSGLTGVKAVAAGQEFGLAIKESGTEKRVVAWGDDEWGQLGNGVKGLEQKSDVPVEVAGLPAGFTPKAIAAGARHALVLLENEKKETKVYAWGFNEFGQLGDGTNEGPEKCLVSEVEGKKTEWGCSDKPVEVKGLSGVTETAISAGYEYSLALTSTGTVKAWGSKEYGTLGNGEKGECKSIECTTKYFKSEPVEVKELKKVTAISAGGLHALALIEGGTVKTWGANEMGQLGNGATETSDVPVEVKGVGGSGALSGVTAVAGGFTHSLALLSSGKVDAWGDNHAGELGNNSETNSDVPVEVLQGLGEVAGVSAGTEFSISYGTPAPIVTGVKPKTGPAAGGTNVTISGTNLNGATAVKFGTANATKFKEVSATSVEATSPPETEKATPVDITVTTPALISRTSEKDRFNYRAEGLKATSWQVNALNIGTVPSPISDWGTLTFENSFDHSLVGKVTCHVVAGGNLWNEGEAGFGKTEGFGTFDCTKEPTACPGTFLTAEEELKLAEVVQGTEKVKVAEHGNPTVPWESEMSEAENTEKTKKFLKDKISKVGLTMDLPCEPLPGEYRFTGTLEPIVENGIGNGLSPTHLKFEGKGGQTGHLLSLNFPTLNEAEREVYVSGELTIVGSSQQLITGE
jgi:alpha-tubulin suppressor-like RCC1 family protein